MALILQNHEEALLKQFAGFHSQVLTQQVSREVKDLIILTSSQIIMKMKILVRDHILGSIILWK